MSDILKGTVKIAGYIFAALLLAFTGWNTWSLLSEVTTPLMAILGLVTFEGGMLYWRAFFQAKAEGLFQMALSFLMFTVDLVLVLLATALHLGAVDSTIFGPNTSASLITAAVIANLTAELIMIFGKPDIELAIKAKVEEAKIMQKAFKKLETKANDISESLADDMAEDMLSNLQQQVLSGRLRPNIIEGEAHHVDQNGRRTPLTAFEPHHLTDEPSFMERFSAWIAGQESDQEIETPTPTTAEQTSPAGPDSDEQQPDPLPPNGRTK